ncbi:MAG: carboxypeptidase-like regulatory domain-containing protein [Pyrinomonadaceae bacterium]
MNGKQGSEVNMYHAVEQNSNNMPTSVPGAATPETTTSTQVKGTVINAVDHSPVPNATVTVTTPAGILPVVTTSTTTGADGKYRIKSIPPGVYDLTVTAPSFTTFTDDSVELKMGEVAAIDVEMEED